VRSLLFSARLYDVRSFESINDARDTPLELVFREPRLDVTTATLAAGFDVYEEEGDLFFEDLSERVITDAVFSRLLTFPNVPTTAHQAFFTTDALERIATTTLDNISAFALGEPSGTEVTPEGVSGA
jgi:hypothetical protein